MSICLGACGAVGIVPSWSLPCEWAELFDGEDKMQQWQEFCEAPEERQMAILRGLDTAQCSKLRRCERPHERYDKIDRRVKALLKVGPCRPPSASLLSNLVARCCPLRLTAFVRKG